MRSGRRSLRADAMAARSRPDIADRRQWSNLDIRGRRQRAMAPRARQRRSLDSASAVEAASRSNQPQALQTRMAMLADNDVVMHGNAERLGDIDDRLGHLDVGLRGRWIAGRMVVHQDYGGRRQFQRALDYFARIDRRVIDGAGLLHLVCDQLVALVEKQQSELLFV